MRRPDQWRPGMALSDAEETVDRVESEIAERTDIDSVPVAMRYVRRAAGSGTLAGVGGVVSLLRGLRAIRRGDRKRGLLHIVLGALFVALAAVQRRARGGGTDVDPADVVDTTPDVEDVGGTGEDVGRGTGRHAGDEAAAVADTSPDIGDVGSATDEGERRGGAATSDREASGYEATDVVDTAPDVEDVGPGAEGESGRDASGETADDGRRDVGEAGTDGEGGSDAEIAEEPDARIGAPDGEADEGATDVNASPDVEEAGGTGAAAGERTYERIGEAAFDEHGRGVPAPQHAFDLNVLSLGDEAFWGIREADDAVVVSGIYDALGEGVRYVASSRIDEERTLQVPDAVTDHWDEVAGGGIAVAGGDELVFAIAEDAADERLLVVPAQWAGDVPGLEGAAE